MKNRYTIPVVALLALCFLVVGAATSEAGSVLKRNIGDLISLGEIIVFGTVVEVTDGIDANNVPYTEVTVNVSEVAKGEAGGTLKFRQFGLIKPRDMGNGRTNLNVTPDGWPTYSKGEEVGLFLYKAAKWTGLRTTVGLHQGKFTVQNGQVSNIVDNEDLFKNLRVDRNLLSDKEREMVSMKQGKLPAELFKSFVTKAVRERWFEKEQELEGE